MDDQQPKIVVITPIKNESWILDRFLAVTSQFADLIVVADQNSSDQSLAICKQYSKVVLIVNESENYDEADRQLLLIKTARDLVPQHKILLALDADEILAANAMSSLGWQTMLKAKPGTVLCFEKPDLYLTPYKCIRYDMPWPIGYVDDGAEHKPKEIHSIRIPTPENATRLHINDVKILHYALTRKEAQASKVRMYSVIENILNNHPFFRRRRVYASAKNWAERGEVSLTPKDWFKAWENLGIDMHTVSCRSYNWYDFEVLQYFYKYGIRRFWLDDIWNFDWESCRLYAMSQSVEDIPDYKVTRPPAAIIFLLKIIDKFIATIRRHSN